ncbi:MAG: tRNA uridine-5-carboxymethylaminomethyl(34) synthesis GTPase MnmE [Bacteroidales bacterium]|jgi:tRNA modification GTPase
MIYAYNSDIICAVATAHGKAALSVIRISGKGSIQLVDKIFESVNVNKKLVEQKSHTLHFGTLRHDDEIIDEVLVSIFKSPNSYTGEDLVEISCHGSTYIQQRILEVLLQEGARLAMPGEFTFRAFQNGKMDLSQAEAVADIIEADNKHSHLNAIRQMRGGFSTTINNLRLELINLVSLIELELDFSEEDVTFADRNQIKSLINKIIDELSDLANSFQMGNVLKNGVPVAIVGKPNVGKSTLLNALLQEERAIVSDIPGTTRDVIQDVMHIKGIAFRFFDTAGLRDETDNVVENLGIEKTLVTLNEANIILYVFDATTITQEELTQILKELKPYLDENKQLIMVGNKIDEMTTVPNPFINLSDLETIYISAKRNENIDQITERLVSYVDKYNLSSSFLVSNARHYNSIIKANKSLSTALKEFDEDVTTDLVSVHLKAALHYLAEITGQISSEDILNSIFSNFCIGK